MRLEQGQQILKTREDPVPVALRQAGDEVGDQFVLSDTSKCDWAKPSETFGVDKLRNRIEPWLATLFQSEHLSLLTGAGLSHAVHQMATGTPMQGMEWTSLQTRNEEFEAALEEAAAAADRTQGNIEDQIRIANELLRGLSILALRDSEKRTEAEALQNELVDLLKGFANAILAGERSFLCAEQEHRQNAFNYLVSFLTSFTSRTGARDRLHIFSTNYDRFIEAGAELAGLHLMDRFVGSLSPIFRSSRLDTDMHYNPPGIRDEPQYLEGVAKFTKLHGSLDWIAVGRVIRRLGVPFGADSISPFLAQCGSESTDASQLLIYPNPAKDYERSLSPYADLLRDFAASICRPNSTLITYGYSFGDDHINRIIEDMLTLPSAHLVVISYDDPLGRIMSTYEKLGRHAQISMLLGPHLGDLSQLVEHYLPKPAIDHTTIRMADLIKARWSGPDETAVSSHEQGHFGESAEESP